MIDVPSPRILIDHLTVICKGCRRQRGFYLDKPLHGAEESDVWLKTELPGCPCGARTCDIKMHIKNPEVLETKEPK